MIKQKQYYIYIISNGKNKYKIGISNNPVSRLIDLNVSSPAKLKLCFTSFCPSKSSAHHNEKKIHNILGKERKTNGEWFELTQLELRALFFYLSDIAIENILKSSQISTSKKLTKIINPIKEKRKLKVEPKIKEEIFELERETTNKVTDDELLELAKIVILKENRASSSLLQRKLSIGYARAARLIDKLAENGFITSYNGCKPRELLI